MANQAVEVTSADDETGSIASNSISQSSSGMNIRKETNKLVHGYSG